MRGPFCLSSVAKKKSLHVFGRLGQCGLSQARDHIFRQPGSYLDTSDQGLVAARREQDVRTGLQQLIHGLSKCWVIGGAVDANNLGNIGAALQCQVALCLAVVDQRVKAKPVRRCLMQVKKRQHVIAQNTVRPVLVVPLNVNLDPHAVLLSGPSSPSSAPWLGAKLQSC